jgi:para-aminobenzoate synthetase component 1
MRPRVLTASLGRWVDPAAAYLAICGSADNTFWLDSGLDATSGVSYLGLAASTTTDFDGPVLDWLRDQWKSAGAAPARAEPSPDPVGFTLGWVGWLSYELRGETMGVAVHRRARYPLAAWHFIDRALAFDHATRQVTLLALDNADATNSDADADTLATWVSTVEAALAASATATSPVIHQHTRPPVTWAHSDEAYLEMVRQCQSAIREGDAYQLCLTTEASSTASPDPVTTYLRLRASSPAHHGSFLRAHGVSVLSASPERFLTVSPDGLVTTSPIKGTRARGATLVDDARLKN